MSLEKIVRPAQSPVTNPPAQKSARRITSNSAPVILRWGVGGSFKTISGSYSAQGSLYAVRRPSEKLFADTGGVFSNSGSIFGGK